MDIIGVVLAGGLSSRMHSDKSELQWKGQSLLEHTKSLLAKSGCSSVIISKNNDKKHIADRFKNSGPLAGIEASLLHIIENYPQTKAMLIMPVDMPLMSAALLTKLLSSYKANHATYYSLGRFPLIIPANKSLSKLMINLLEKRENARGVSIKQLLSHLDCECINIEPDQKKAFINCNTEQQWRNIQSDKVN